LSGLPLSDFWCGVFAYAYVALVWLAVERLWRGDRALGRKILHMAVGNIVFFLWLLTSPWTALVVAGSFVLFSLLLTSRMQRSLRGLLGRIPEGTRPGKAGRKVLAKLSTISVTGAGNEFGLVYYCLAFTALAFLFYDRPIVVAAGMLPLALGDGMGAVIGLNYGAHRYRIVDRKSLEGTLAVFAAAAAGVAFGLLFYGMAWPQAAAMAVAIGLVTAVVEAAAPWGLDNLAIPACASGAFLLLGGGA
jgi:phytol kinase